MDDFDFDYWMKLAKDDPKEFEKKRAETLYTLINSTTNETMRKRLTAMQWRSDIERDREADPDKTLKRLQKDMLDKVYAKDGLLESLNKVTQHFNK